MSYDRKLLLTAILFAVGIGFVIVSIAAKEAWPLFLAWVPLVSVAWVLTRPDPEPVVASREASPGDEPSPGQVGEGPPGNDEPPPSA